MDRAVRDLTDHRAPASATPRPRTLAQAVEAYTERLVRLGAEICASVPIGPAASADLRSAAS